MARKVFFSFHYQRDIHRVNIVRNSWVTRGGQSQTFYDRSLWEATRARGHVAIKALIDGGLQGTSVTVVLVGNETYGRKWIDYEIDQSYLRGNGILAVRIHSLSNMHGYRDLPGRNPLEKWQLPSSKGGASFSKLYPIYDWVINDGYRNFPAWVDLAAKLAGR